MKQKKIKEILEKNKNDWEEIADKFSQTRGNLWNEFKDLTKEVKKGDRVLDLGCGNGRLFQLFQNKGVDYLGVDQSKNLIFWAQKKFSQGRFIVADALDLPFQKKQFDFIFSFAFLHHLPWQKLRLKVLKDCFSFLDKRGHLILTVWNLYQPCLVKKYHLFKIFFGLRDVFIPFKDKEKNKEIKRYYHVFTKVELKNLVRKAGFKIKKIYYVKKDQPSNWRQGYNLVLIAQK